MAKTKKKVAAVQPSTQPAPRPPEFGSIYPGRPPDPLLVPNFAIQPELAATVEELEAAVNLPIWLLVQDAPSDQPGGGDSFNMLGERVADAFFRARHDDLKKGQRIAVIVDSNGGLARQSYEISMLLRRHCGGFVAIIPRHAKSAATLLTLGADEIVMNDHAELGPLDVQMFDPDREEWMSGLDEVQALERLQAFAMDATDRMTMMLLNRTRKKVKTVIPFVTEFVASLTKPMFQSVDVVRYTQMSRMLKVAEEYGKRLLKKNYGDGADEIARKLVETYPEHGFPIYPDEAVELGLRIARPNARVRAALEKVTRCLPNQNVVGRIIK